MSHHALSSISLFSGAGGLDLGLERAGFDTRVCVEIDEDARATIRLNRPQWVLAEPSDIHQLHPQQLLQQAGLSRGEVSLLAGGPPCQPFSKSGYWVSGDTSRLSDPRAQTIAAYLLVMEAALPQVILIENVKGFAFRRKNEALELLYEQIQQINERNGTSYRPHVLHMNAADYGVPQNRERVFIVASRNGDDFSLPTPTHGSDCAQPYTTAWDAIGHLPLSKDEPLQLKGKWADLFPSIPEGHNYLWHTDRMGGRPLFGWRTRYWSFLLKLAKNRPSWTIQASPGPSTGPVHWENRYLSTQELAAIQTFPSDYLFSGSYKSIHKQIGNAVPSAIGELLGKEIRRQILGDNVAEGLSLIPSRKACPSPEKVVEVPDKYLILEGSYAAHPGEGYGPRGTKKQS